MNGETIIHASEAGFDRAAVKKRFVADGVLVGAESCGAEW